MFAYRSKIKFWTDFLLDSWILEEGKVKTTQSIQCSQYGTLLLRLLILIINFFCYVRFTGMQNTWNTGSYATDAVSNK